MPDTRLQANSRLLQAIGPRLYPDASTGIIELVSNSYDADATCVRIGVKPDEITVADNGRGMNDALLTNFFTLGKSIKPPSSLGRQPIGQFGIGKFAILAMANKFDVYGAYGGNGPIEYAKASFDGTNYGDDSMLDDIIIPINPISKAGWEDMVLAAGIPNDPDAKHSFDTYKTGVIIVLRDMRSVFGEELVRAKVIERLSHTFKNAFDVYVNSELAEERYIHGARYVVEQVTEHGKITGEVIAAPDTFKLGNLVGIRVQVRGRMVKRDLFGGENYDYETSRQITGYIDVDFLNDSITPDRTGFIDSPQWETVKKVMQPVVNEIIERENQNRNNDMAQKQSKMLSRAVRQVTAVLRSFPNLSFPETFLTDSIPVQLIKDEHKAEVVAELEPEAPLQANIQAERANLDQIINAIKKMAEQLRLSDTTQEDDDNIQSYSDIVDAINKLLGDDAAPLVNDINAMLTGKVFDQQNIEAAQQLVTERIIGAITDFIKRQLEKFGDAGDLSGMLTGNPTLAGDKNLGFGNDRFGRSAANRLRIRPPVMGNVVPVQKPLKPTLPENADTVMPMPINPNEEGNDVNGGMADIRSYVAVTIEHLGPSGPASMLAEGFGYNGTMIYVNADHSVYKEMEAVRMGYLAFYVAQLIVDEVLGLQATMSHREKIDIKAELLKQMMLRDRRMLYRK